MDRKLVIKNTETNKYYTGDYNGFWSLDIKDAETYSTEGYLEKTLEKENHSDDSNGAFENVKCVIVETIYLK